MATSISAGTVRLVAGANITFQTGAGSTITISGAAGAGATAISGLANSETTYTSGTVNLSVVGGALTIRSTTGNAFQFSVSQSVQAETQTFVGGIKNTETTYTSGTIEFEGTNNITVFSTTGQRFRISGANSHAQQTAISGIGNSETTYTSGTVNLSVVGGALTIRSTTGNAFQFSVSQSVQAAQTGISGISNSETTYTSGTVGLSVVGGPMTIRSTTGNAFQFSVSQSVQAETQTFIGGISNSETNYTSGTVKFSELGAITIRSTTGQNFQFSVNSQTVQTQNMVAVSATNTLYSSGTVLFTGSNMVTVKSSAAGQTIIIDATQSVQTGGIYVTAQSTGQSSSSTYDLRTLSLVPDGIISAGWSGGSFRISAPAQTALTATTVSSVSNANAVGANNSRFAMEAHIHQGMMALGVSNLGNTAGSTKTVPGIGVLVGSNFISLSQSTDANSGATISIMGPAVVSRLVVNQGGRTQTTQQINGSASIAYMAVPWPVSFSRVDMPVIVSLASSATTNTANLLISSVCVIYTANGSTLNPIIGASGTTTHTWASNTSNFANISGGRLVSFPIATSLSAGDYFVLFQLSTANTSSIGLSTTQLANSISMAVHDPFVNTAIADFGVATANTLGSIAMNGMYSATISATSVTLQQSQITVTGNVGAGAQPYFLVRNI